MTTTQHKHDNQQDSQHGGGIIESGGRKTIVKTMFFFCVQLCLDPWTVQRQADLRTYLFLGGKVMFLCFYVKKLCLWTPS
jgi:hypothetical protein